SLQEGLGALGLLGGDSRVQTLRRVLVSYAEVRHILPDRISLDASADPRLLENIAKFLERQSWLVRGVSIEELARGRRRGAARGDIGTAATGARGMSAAGRGAARRADPRPPWATSKTFPS